MQREQWERNNLEQISPVRWAPCPSLDHPHVKTAKRAGEQTKNPKEAVRTKGRKEDKEAEGSKEAVKDSRRLVNWGRVFKFHNWRLTSNVVDLRWAANFEIGTPEPGQTQGCKGKGEI